MKTMSIYAMIKFPNKTIFVRDVNGKQSVSIEGKEQEITQQEKQWIMDIAMFIEDM